MPTKRPPIRASAVLGETAWRIVVFGLWFFAVFALMLRDPARRDLWHVALAALIAEAPLALWMGVRRERRRVLARQLSEDAASQSPAGPALDVEVYRGSELRPLARVIAGLRNRPVAAGAGPLDEPPSPAALIDASADGFLVIAPDDVVIYANRAVHATLAGTLRGRRVVIGEIFRDIVFHRELEGVRADGRPRRFPLERTVDLHFDIRLVALPPAVPAAVPDIAAVIRDISREVRLEAARRDFVANVGHELRTPLAAVSGYVESLVEGAIEEPETARRFLGIIERHTHRLDTLIADLLELAHLEDPAFRLPKVEPLRLPDLVAQAIDFTRHKFEPKGIAVDNRIVEPLPAVLGLRTPLERAFVNLLENAANYSERGTTVRLEARADEGGVEAAIVDQGIGIAPEHQARIFERFYRVDKDRSRAVGGTGLGLSIVKHIVNRCGGAVSVDSAPGKGSTFRVRLRRATSNATAGERTSNA